MQNDYFFSKKHIFKYGGFMKCTIVYNPVSGNRVSSATINKMVDILNKKYEVEIIKSEYKNHITEIIRNIPYRDLVIVLGGDGTFNEMVTGNLERKSPLLVSYIPTGTTNDIGSMYGYNKNVIKNLNLILKGKIKSVDIFKINDRIFTYSLGIGKFTDVSYRTKSKMKQKIGYKAYIIECIKEILTPTKFYNIKYEVDGFKLEGKYSLILISNSNHIAGIKNIYNNIKLDDGKFEVALVTAKNKFVYLFLKLFIKNMESIKDLELRKTRKLKIIFEDEGIKKFEVDGEEYKSDKNVYDIRFFRKMDILVPDKHIKKLFK